MIVEAKEFEKKIIEPGFFDDQELVNVKGDLSIRNLMIKSWPSNAFFEDRVSINNCSFQAISPDNIITFENDGIIKYSDDFFNMFIQVNALETFICYSDDEVEINHINPYGDCIFHVQKRCKFMKNQLEVMGNLYLSGGLFLLPKELLMAHGDLRLGTDTLGIEQVSFPFDTIVSGSVVKSKKVKDNSSIINTAKCNSLIILGQCDIPISTTKINHKIINVLKPDILRI